MKNKWVPVIKGKNKDLYCSPGCGANCTKVAYDKAVKDSNALCEKLGSAWISHVWENMGWYYTAKLIVPEGYIEVFPRKGDSKAYWIDSRLPGQLYLYTDDPIEGVKELLEQAKNAAEKVLEIIVTLETDNAL